MFRSKLSISGWVLFLFSSLSFSDNFILDVAGKKFTQFDLQVIMQENHFDLPEQAIQKLQHDAAFASLNEKEADVYKKAFGEDLKSDDVRINALDLPIISKKASARKFMFDTWAGERACKVPVKYLDIEKYWDMVKQTKSYQIRAEAGMVMSLENIAYTAAELALPEQQAVALKNKRVFLRGADFNSYLNSNYNAIRDFVKRDKSLAAAQNFLITKITGEQLASETVNPSESGGDELETERRTDRFVRAHMLDEPIDFTGADFLSPSDMMESLYLKYTQKHSREIQTLKQAFLEPSKTDGITPEMRSYILNVKTDLLKSRISGRQSDSDIRNWMAGSGFRGSYDEARFTLSNIRYEEHLAQTIKDNKIELNLLAE